MGVIIDEIDFDEYHKIKKKTDKDPNLEKRIRKITPEEVLKEIEAGASYNLRLIVHNCNLGTHFLKTNK